jgi:transmembrane sensor
VTETPDTELDEILAAAASWHTRLDLGTADERAFEAWRDADPRHAAAFARMEGTDGAVARVRHRIEGEVDEFEVAPPQMTRRRWLTGGLSTLGALTLGGGGFAAFALHRAHAETPIGGRTGIALADGGRLDINTNSRASWRFSRTVREIWLERGEIALSLPVEARPVRIHADGHIISGQGGKMNLRLRDEGVEVTVIEGKGVVVAGDGAKAYGLETLDTGNSVLAIDGDTSVKQMTVEDLQIVTAWQSDEMLLTGQTLEAVVNEYNRYLTRKIVIRDAALMPIQLGGRFNVHDTTGFLTSLHAGFGIRVTETAQAIELSR